MSTWRTIVIQVTATATPGNGSANLNWDVTGVTDPAIAGVWIWRIGTLSSEGIWYRELKGSHIFTGLINGTEYDLRVTVVRDGGAELAYGGGKTTPTGTTNPNPEPPVAQTLTATKDTMVRGDDPNRTDFGGKDTMVRGDDPNRTDFGGKDTMRVDDGAPKISYVEFPALQSTGNAKLRLTASDGILTAEDRVTVTVAAALTNRGPAT
jgi:hypothetical protein